MAIPCTNDVFPAPIGPCSKTSDSGFNTFESLEKEAKNLLLNKLPLPAYDYSLKASHVFNILDSRGAISTAQRAGYISRIRDLVKEVGLKWLEEKK